jgi:hypothetical protein
VDWWGGYNKLGNVLLVDPKLPTPIVFVGSGVQGIKCITIQCLLESITRMLSDELYQRDDETFWKALARTIASNFLYLGELGFGTQILPLEWFDQSFGPHFSPGTRIINEQLDSCGLLHTFDFIDCRVFFPKPSSFSKAPDSAESIVTLDRLIPYLVFLLTAFFFFSKMV